MNGEFEKRAFAAMFLLGVIFLFPYFLLGGDEAQAQSDRYEVDFSLRFATESSTYLSRTFTQPGTSTKWTFSAWVKRGKISTTQYLISAATTSPTTANDNIFFDSSDRINVSTGGSRGGLNLCGTDPATDMNKISNAVFRDQSAWFHLVVAVDTTQSTAANRNRVYVNGTEITSWSTNTNITQNAGTCMTGMTTRNIGRDASGATSYFDGLLADVVLIDGTQFTPSAFGYADSNGYWRPKETIGTTTSQPTNGPFGTTGFRLDFASTTLGGNDRSGRNNDFTTNNFGSDMVDDQFIDTPSHSYAQLNSEMLWAGTHSKATVRRGGLESYHAGLFRAIGNYQMVSGKWYWETTYLGFGLQPCIGVSTSTGYLSGAARYAGETAGSGASYCSTGLLYTGGAGASFGSTFTTGDTIGVAFDADTGKLWFAKNNSWQASGDPAAGTNQAATLIGGLYFPAFGVTNLDNEGAVTQLRTNFGQGGTSTAPYRADAGGKFSYAPPSGFKALSTINLPSVTIPKSSEYFDVLTWTGNATDPRSITGLNFQPDFVWAKARSNAAFFHNLTDSIRGVAKTFYSNATNAEVANNACGYLSAFLSDGFTASAGTGSGCVGSYGNTDFNNNGDTYVAWNWKESATAGFDVVTYTGDGASDKVISHSLNSAPEMIIVKRRDSTASWAVGHTSLTNWNWYLLLNGTNAQTGDATVFTSTPSSSTFSVGASTTVNASGGTYVAYLFDEKAGFSKTGTYAGNSSTDGPFLWTGFKPRFVLWKRVDSTGSWAIFDSARDPFNVAGRFLLSDTTGVEGSGSYVDLLPNGFKLRIGDANNNATGGTYIYMAFAEQPFKLSATNNDLRLANLFGPSGETIITDSLTIRGNLSIVYNLSKGSGSFVIDHPLDPLNKLLYHFFVESPDMKNIYDGVAELDGNGEAVIELPGYFLALNSDFRYLATAMGQPMPNLHLKKEVRPRWWGWFGTPVFKISGGAPNGKVSWQVTGVRKDLFAKENPIRVEVEKGPNEMVEKGEYLYPELYK